MTKSKMPRRSWASGRGALAAIAILLIGSALIRFGIGPGAAIALEMKDQAAEFLNGQEADVADAPSATDLTPELLQLLAEVKKKEQALLDREAALEARVQTLSLVETAVQEDLARLEKAEADLRATMALADEAAENDIVRLTAVYENMKPDQAAALFQLMEPSFAAGFLGRMRSDAAAAILAGLEPDLAYSISVVLAGRNAEVPREPVPEPPEEIARE